MSVDILTLKQKQYISLPGDHKHLEITCEDQLLSQIANIYIISYLQKHEPYFGYHIFPDVCVDDKNMYCITIMGSNIKYLVYADVSAYYQNNWIRR